MKQYKLKMQIVDFQDGFWKIRIRYGFRRTFIFYNPENKELHIPERGKLSKFIKLRKVQLFRILNNKNAESFYKNFTLTFVLSKNRIQPQYFNRDLITVIDHRKRHRQHYTKPVISSDLSCEIYTDGSYNHENNRGAFAVMIRKTDCDTEVLTYKDNDFSNNSLELKAIVKAFEKVKREKKILVTTDSQYVIRGICYWIQNWKRNNWRTASGKIVKNINYWKRLDQLIKGKYVEFKWVRAHKDHPENNLCDFFARHRTKEQEPFDDFYNTN